MAKSKLVQFKVEPERFKAWKREAEHLRKRFGGDAVGYAFADWIRTACDTFAADCADARESESPTKKRTKK